MKKLIFCICLCIIFYAANATAQKFYAELDHIFVDYSETGGYEADLQMMRVRFGALITPNFAFEARFGRGIKSDTLDVLGIKVKLELGNAYGFYINGILPITETFRIYLPIGFTSGTGTAIAAGISVTETETDFSYGLGAEFFSGKSFSFVIEYMQFIDKTDFKYSGLGCGFKFYFN